MGRGASGRRRRSERVKVLLDEMLPIGVVLIPHNDIDLIRPYAGELLDAVANVTPRLVVRIPAG